MTFTRYAVYYTPPTGHFAQAGAKWLGWDSVSCLQHCSPVPDLVERPQKYGFHATMKAPFIMEQGQTEQNLCAALETLACSNAPVETEGLKITQMGGFLALNIIGDATGVQKLAARCVRDLDPFRAPLSPQERQRKLRPNMPQSLRDNLDLWGYPFVMDAYRFHMTLTGRLEPAHRPNAIETAQKHFADVLPRPFLLDSLTLVGEGEQGRFCQIERFALSTGTAPG